MNEPTTADAYAEGFPYSPEYETLIFPRPSKWSCNAYGVNYRPMKGNHPNWFHRQMSALLLGIHWVKDVESE